MEFRSDTESKPEGMDRPQRRTNSWNRQRTAKHSRLVNNELGNPIWIPLTPLPWVRLDSREPAPIPWPVVRESTSKADHRRPVRRRVARPNRKRRPRRVEPVTRPTETQNRVTQNVKPESQPKQVEPPKCNVCFDDKQEIEGTQRKLIATKCGHLFCDECIERVRKARKQCPLCQTKLIPKSVIQLLF